MSNSIGHGFVKTDEPNLSKLNKQAKSLVAIAADCGWTVRQSPVGMVVLETGHVGGEIGYRQIVVPTTSTRGPWAISGLRKILLYGSRNTAKYQAGLAVLGDKGLQLSDLIKWTQVDHDEPEQMLLEPTPADVAEAKADETARDAYPEAETESAVPVTEPEPEVIDHPPLVDPLPLGERSRDWDADPEDDAEVTARAVAYGLAGSKARDLLETIGDLIVTHNASLHLRIAELEAELASERALRTTADDNLTALADLIGQIRGT